VKRIFSASVPSKEQIRCFGIAGKLSLPEPAHVTVAVFDITGCHVATLVDRLMPSGEHATDFDATDLSSGIYVYRIQAGGFCQDAVHDAGKISRKCDKILPGKNILSGLVNAHYRGSLKCA